MKQQEYQSERAANEFFDGKLYYAINEERQTASVTGAKGNIRNVIVPDFIELSGSKLPVIAIARDAFMGHKMKTIIVGNNVESIQNHAFHGCVNLTHVTLGNKVRRLHVGTFYECVQLLEISFPSTLESIDPMAFFGCIRVNDIISEVKNPAKCEIGAFGFPDEIYQRAYLRVPDESLTLYVLDVKWTRFVNIFGQTPVSISENHIVGHDECGLVDEYGARYSIDGTTLLSVPKELTNYKILNGTTTIGENSFSHSRIELVEIPDSVHVIKDSAFVDCHYLKNINLPKGVSEIGYSAFEGCSKLTSIALPRELEGISTRTFRDCVSLERVYIPSGVQYVGLGAFGGCEKLKSIVIPSMAGIEAFAFAGCKSLHEISLPILSRSEQIEYELFSECESLEKVYYPYDYIGDNMFAGCTGLKTIIIAGKLNYVEDSAFNNCHNLETVDFLCPVDEEIHTFAFENFYRFSGGHRHEIEFKIPGGFEARFSKLFNIANQDRRVKITIKPEKSS